jgi:hypothetical protein
MAEIIEEHPHGLPQLAAFLNSADHFAIYRRFGVSHCRILVQLQIEIAQLEKYLSEIDRQDSAAESMAWRLHTTEFPDSHNSPRQKDLLEQLRGKLLLYGKCTPHHKVSILELIY